MRRAKGVFAVSILHRLSAFISPMKKTGVPLQTAYVRMEEPKPSFFAITYLSALMNGKPGADAFFVEQVLAPLPENLRPYGQSWLKIITAWRILQLVRQRYGLDFAEQSLRELATVVQPTTTYPENEHFARAVALCGYWFPIFDKCASLPPPPGFPTEMIGNIQCRFLATALLRNCPEGPIFTDDDAGTCIHLSNALEAVQDSEEAGLHRLVEIGSPIKDL